MTVLVIWNILLSTILIGFVVVVGRLIEEIEAIKSWYPFCDLLKIQGRVRDLTGENKNGNIHSRGRTS
jgi:hypothetical protein